MTDKTSAKSKGTAKGETDKTDAQAHRERRKDEPAAAPLETDAEAGSKSLGQVIPAEGGQKETPSADQTDHEDAPWVQDSPRHRPRLSPSLVLGLFVVGIIVLVIVVAAV